MAKNKKQDRISSSACVRARPAGGTAGPRMEAQPSSGRRRRAARQMSPARTSRSASATTDVCTRAVEPRHA